MITSDELAATLAILNREGAAEQGTVELGPYSLEYVKPRIFAATAELIFGQRIYDAAPLDSAQRILDGGGWLGLSVLRFRELYPHASITVFEPDPHLYEIMCRNLERNGIKGVEPIQAALSDIEGAANFHATGSDSGALEPSNAGSPVGVRVVRLAPYVRAPVSLLKLNVEGAEWNIMRDLGARLADIDQVLLEYHGFAELPQTLHQILKTLHDAGHTYVISHFNERNKACVPPLSLDASYRFFLLVYSRRLGRPVER